MADKKISQLTGATTPLGGTEVLPLVQSSTTKKVAVSDLTAGRAVSASSLDLNGGNNVGGIIVSGSISGIRASSTVIDQGDGSRFLALGPNASTLATIKLIAATSDAAQYKYIAESDSNSNLKVTTGNLVVGTAGKGIDFSANTHAAGMTSELLTWYEEGTWTPSLVPGTSGSISLSTANGLYTRIGRQVSITCTLVCSGVSSPVGELRLSGLPFTVSATGTTSFSIFAYGLAATATTSLVGVTSGTNTFAVLSKYAAGGVSDLTADVQNGTGMYIGFTYFV